MSDTDRIGFYDDLTFEPTSTLRDEKLMGNVPLSMSATALADREILTVGDNGGNVALVTFQVR